MVDANGQMSVKQAIRIGHTMQELNPTWFEEPVIITTMKARRRGLPRSTRHRHQAKLCTRIAHPADAGSAVG
jgi:L-alanine-DL-glutamate epimerase-like enolase superfamily enzyme